MPSFRNGNHIEQNTCLSSLARKHPLLNSIVVAVEQWRATSFVALIAGPRIGTVTHVV
jgi:hypothetical protein